jgi:RecA/RadA recombinase
MFRHRPKIVFKNLFILTAYNKNHQLSVAEQVTKLIESNKDIKLLVIHNLTRFFKDSTANKKMETANLLKQSIGMISKVCGKNKVALVCTADSNTTSRGMIPKPTGGLYLKHAANVIVHIKEQSGTSTVPSFKATLSKHQYAKTPKSAILYIKKTGGMVLLD